MKLLAILLFSLCSFSGVFAQNENNLYADISVNSPAASATYDRKLTKHLQLGAGMQVLDNTYKYKNITGAIFVDVRPYWLKRKNLFFLLADVGLATHFGKAPDPTKYEVRPAAFYSAFGLGYSRIVTKSGMGPYISLALRGFGRGEHSFNPALPAYARDYSVFDAMLFISLGFKF